MNKGNTNKGLGVIPKGWEVLPFDEVFEFVSSYAVSRDNLTVERTKGLVQNIHYGDIHAKFTNEVLDLNVVEELPFIKDEALNGNSFSFVKDGDLIIADVSEDYEGIGECVELLNVGDKKVVGGLHTFVARAIDGKTTNGFRCYILRNPAVRLNLKKLATGSNVYGVSKTNLSELKLIIPSLPEQRKIAIILSTCDKAIETTQKLITTKEQLKKGLMQKLLGGEKKFDRSKEKWKIIKLGNYVKIKSGESPSKFELNDTGITPYLKVEDLNDCTLDMTPSRFYTQNNISHVPKGSIVFPKRGAAIMNNKVIITTKPVLMDSNLMAVFPIAGDIIPEFLYYKLQHEKLYKIADTSSIPQINNKHIEPYRISLPPFGEQQRIVSVLYGCDKEIQLLKKQLQKQKEEKKGLMKVLLTGEVRVKTTR